MRNVLRNTLTFLLGVFILVGSLSADNWHQWRGPNNDGVSQETDAPIQWSQTENIRWRLPLPGDAASTPVVWEDKIFLTSAEGNTLVLMCVSTEGEELWKRTLGRGNRVVRGGEGNSAAPSPVTDGEHVWAFLGTGDLACYDFDGNQVWHTNLADRYGRFNLYFVMSTTPLLDKDRLYIQLIHSNAWLVLALDKMTGEEIWKHKRDSDATEECEHAYTSPILYRDSEREYLVVHGADNAGSRRRSHE